MNKITILITLVLSNMSIAAPLTLWMPDCNKPSPQTPYADCVPVAEATRCLQNGYQKITLDLNINRIRKKVWSSVTNGWVLNPNAEDPKKLLSDLETYLKSPSYSSKVAGVCMGEFGSYWENDFIDNPPEDVLFGYSINSFTKEVLNVFDRNQKPRPDVMIAPYTQSGDNKDYQNEKIRYADAIRRLSPLFNRITWQTNNGVPRYSGPLFQEMGSFVLSKIKGSGRRADVQWEISRRNQYDIPWVSCDTYEAHKNLGFDQVSIWGFFFTDLANAEIQKCVDGNLPKSLRPIVSKISDSNNSVDISQLHNRKKGNIKSLAEWVEISNGRRLIVALSRQAKVKLVRVTALRKISNNIYFPQNIKVSSSLNGSTPVTQSQIPLSWNSMLDGMSNGPDSWYGYDSHIDGIMRMSNPQMLNVVADKLYLDFTGYNSYQIRISEIEIFGE